MQPGELGGKAFWEFITHWVVLLVRNQFSTSGGEISPTFRFVTPWVAFYRSGEFRAHWVRNCNSFSINKIKLPEPLQYLLLKSLSQGQTMS